MPYPDTDEVFALPDTRPMANQKVANLLFVCGFVLLASAFNALIFALIPPSLLQPDWQLLFASTLLNTGVPALLGCILLYLSSVYNANDNRLAGRVRLVRRLAVLLAITFFALIPLQGYAGAKALRQRAAQEAQAVASLKKVLDQIRMVTNEEDLRNIASRLPNPPQLPDKLPDTVSSIRARLINEIEPRYNALRTRQETLSSERLQQWLGEFARNSIQSVLFGLAFAAIGQWKSGQPTFLQALGSYRPFGTRRNRRTTMPIEWGAGK